MKMIVTALGTAALASCGLFGQAIFPPDDGRRPCPQIPLAPDLHIDEYLIRLFGWRWALASNLLCRNSSRGERSSVHIGSTAE